MKTHLILLAALLLPVTCLRAEISAQPANTVVVQGRGEVRAPNTLALIELGFHAEGPEETAVREEVGRRSKSVLEVLKKAGVARLETGSLSISPRFTPPEPGPSSLPPKFSYSAHATLRFEVPVAEAGRIITTAVEAGANSVANFQTQPSDEAKRSASNEALSAAAKDAEAQARTLLNAAELKWTGIRAIDATGGSPAPFAMPRAAMMSAESSSPDIQIEAGETVVSREVTMQVGFQSP